MDTLKKTEIPEQGLTQHYEVMTELGDCHTAVGNYEEAERCYDKATNLAPDEAAPYVGIGVISMQTGQIEDAEAAFSVARHLDPKCSRAYCGLAMISQQRSQWSDAFDLYLKSLEFDGDNLTALLGLFQTSCEMKSFSKVIHYLQVYLEMHPDDTAVMFCLATLYLKDGDAMMSRNILKRITDTDPSNEEALDLLEEVDHVLAQQN